MMTRLEVHLIIEHHILQYERAMTARQRQIALLIVGVGNVRRAAVLEVLSLFPVDQIQIVQTRVKSIL